MRNVALLIAYDGSGFAGSQRQAGVRTVQGDLEMALQNLTGEAPDVARFAAAGRTDAGVHARGMVVNFRTGCAYAPRAWVGALNTRLPEDIRILDAAEVQERFHSRFSACSRSYRYEVLTCRYPDPLVRKHVVWEPRALPARDALVESFRSIVGTHDFSAFGSTSSSARSPVCTVMEADVEDGGQRLVFRVKAQSFLYHMVRRLVGAALEVGRGRFSASAFRELLEPGRHRFVPPTAPARGLVFWSVEYRPPYAGLFGSLLGGAT